MQYILQTKCLKLFCVWEIAYDLSLIHMLKKILFIYYFLFSYHHSTIVCLFQKDTSMERKKKKKATWQRKSRIVCNHCNWWVHWRLGQIKLKATFEEVVYLFLHPSTFPFPIWYVYGSPGNGTKPKQGFPQFTHQTSVSGECDILFSCRSILFLCANYRV